MSDKPIDALPRPDLREKAFRKYERYINRALHETYELDPAIELRMKPHSFIVRFKDAVLGFQRYRYSSIFFSHDTDFKPIKLYELANGYVRIVNESLADSLLSKANVNSSLLHVSRDMLRILEIAKQYHLHAREDQTFVQYSTPEERTKMINLQTDHDGDYSIDVRDFGPGIVVMRQ
jgi:hypothetical protein